MIVFFFFKQKTAYEMRISDWSSDVCSSDLWLTWVACSTWFRFTSAPTAAQKAWYSCEISIRLGSGGQSNWNEMGVPTGWPSERSGSLTYSSSSDRASSESFVGHAAAAASEYQGLSWLKYWSCRSEEHTSELQSLM